MCHPDKYLQHIDGKIAILMIECRHFRISHVVAFPQSTANHMSEIHPSLFFSRRKTLSMGRLRARARARARAYACGMISPVVVSTMYVSAPVRQNNSPKCPVAHYDCSCTLSDVFPSRHFVFVQRCSGKFNAADHCVTSKHQGNRI